MSSSTAASTSARLRLTFFSIATTGLILQYAARCSHNDALSPVPDYSLSVNAGTRVITLTVREGLHKPYLYRSKAYRWSDTATVEADQVELRCLVLEGQNLTFGATPSRRHDLSFSRLVDYESACEESDNIEQRKRRRVFYLKSGLYETGWFYRSNGIEFAVAALRKSSMSRHLALSGAS